MHQTMDWETAESHLKQQDPIMAALVERNGPCRLTPKHDYFTTLCKSIISQQLSTRSAAAIFDRTINLFGQSILPGDVAATSPEELRSLGLSGQKINYLYDLARHFVEGTINPAIVGSLPDNEIIDRLTAVKGIGVWTAQMFLIFALNRPDVLPWDDFGIKKAMLNLYSLDKLPDKKQMDLIAEPWKPYRSVASWYLWRSLEN